MMALVYYVNLLLFIPIMFLTTKLVLKKFNWTIISLPGFVFLTTLPVVFLKRFGSLFIDRVSFESKYFQFSILMDNIYLIIVLLKTYLFIKYFNVIINCLYTWSKKIPVHLIRYNLYKGNTNWIYWISFILYSLFFLLLTNTNTNTIDWILDPRSGYQLYRVGAGHWYALSILFLGVNSVLYFIYRIKRKYFFFAVVIYSYLWFLFGGKAYILYLFLLILSSVSIYYSKSVLTYFFSGSILVSLILMLLLFFNNYDGFTSLDALDEVFNYFDHYYFASLFYEDYFNGRVDFYYGEIFFTDFYKYIPRFIFTDKPFVYGSMILNELYLPGYAENGITPEFAGQAPLFADFGIWGVILFNLIDLNFIFSIISMLVVYMSIAYNVNKRSGIFLFFFIFSLAPAFSQFITFPFNIIVLFGILILSNSFYKRSNHLLK